MNLLLSQNAGQLSSSAWFYKPYLEDSYHGWVVELAEPHCGCRALMLVTLQVKPRNNLQVQQEKWDSTKWMVWESHFVIVLFIPDMGCPSCELKAPLTGVPKRSQHSIVLHVTRICPLALAKTEALRRQSKREASYLAWLVRAWCQKHQGHGFKPCRGHWLKS